MILLAHFLALLLLATLALAKQVISPLGSLDIEKANGGGKTGSADDVWNMNFQFALKPYDDNVQAGDFFRFTVDDKLSFGSNIFNFDVKDAKGNVIMKITNSGKTFTGTYTDYVATNNDDISGLVKIQTQFDKSKLKVVGPTTVTVTPQVGGKTLADTVNLLASANSNGAWKSGEKNGCCILYWTIQLPSSPYNRALISDTVTDGKTQNFDIGMVQGNTNLVFLYDVNAFGGFSKKTYVMGADVAKYLTYTQMSPTQWTAQLQNIPDNVNVQIIYPARIATQSSSYKNSYQYTIWDEPYSDTGDKWAAGGEQRGSGGGSASDVAPNGIGPNLGGGGDGSGNGKRKY